MSCADPMRSADPSYSYNCTLRVLQRTMFCTAASAARTALVGRGSASLRMRVAPLASRKATSGGHQRRFLSEKAKQETTDSAAAKEKKGGGGWWNSAEFWGGLGALAGWGSELIELIHSVENGNGADKSILSCMNHVAH